MAPASPTTLQPQAAQLEALKGIPTHFTVVSGKVTELLPDDTHGLPHQRFMIRLDKPMAGKILEVDHSISHGRRVTGLTVGEAVVIRGVIFSGNKDGIHWTHHANKPGDAGYIKDSDGQLFE